MLGRQVTFSAKRKKQFQDGMNEMTIFNENKHQTAQIANFFMVDESIVKNQFTTLASKYHKNFSRKHQQMEFRDDEIFKHSKVFGYAPDFTSQKFISQRIRKLTNKLENSPIKKQLLEDISLCRKELQTRILEQIAYKCAKYKNIEEVKRSKLLLKPGYDHDQHNNVEFDNNRRVHFYHGMEKEKYHKMFDQMYHTRIEEEQEAYNSASREYEDDQEDTVVNKQVPV